MNIYEMLFADQDLDELLLEVDLPAGGPLDVARARLWEGSYQDTARLAAGGTEPWASFIAATARSRAGQDPKRILLGIAEDSFQESRARLWAWTALRKAGERPSAVHADEVLGLVLEVPMEGKLDVLAAYADGGVRFLGYADQLVIREAGGQPSPTVAKVLAEAQALLSIPPAPRAKDAPAPPPDKLRMSALSARGIHTAEVPWAEVEPGGEYGALFAAATKLLDEVTRA
jgi:hypothetical protein